MTLSHRVLWEEGMFLGPQHFQQSERHLLHQQHGRTSAINPHGYGWTSATVNEDALTGDEPEFGLRGLQGVLKDGTFIDAPHVDALPQPRKLEAVFGARQPHLIAYVGVPTARIGAMVSRRDSAARGRFRRRVVAVIDEDKGVLERDVALGELDLRIVFEGESDEGLTLLPIARLTRGSDAKIELDRSFVPPLLWIKASQSLSARVEKLLKYITTKTDQLRSKRGQRIGGNAQFTAIDAAVFWLLHTLNTHLPLLSHYHHEQRQHPESLYRDLATLVGSLTTFAKEKAEIPAYNHAAPGRVFEKLEALIFKLSQDSGPETCVPIPLREKGPAGEYSGQILDVSLLASADFYIAARADVPADVIIREFPSAAKLGPPNEVAHAREYAVRCVQMTHVSPAPAEIPQPGGFHYFVIDTRDSKWELVRSEHTVEVYVPAKFPEATVELFAVRKKS